MYPGSSIEFSDIFPGNMCGKLHLVTLLFGEYVMTLTQRYHSGVEVIGSTFGLTVALIKSSSRNMFLKIFENFKGLF